MPTTPTRERRLPTHGLPVGLPAELPVSQLRDELPVDELPVNEPPAKCNRRAMLVTFTEYSECDKFGRYVREPSHHTVGFLKVDDLKRYKLLHKQRNGADLFVSGHTNIPLRPCCIVVTGRSGRKNEYSASYCYANYYEGHSDSKLMLFVLADSTNSRVTFRSSCNLSFSAESFMVKQANGVQTFVGGGRKYRIVATD